MPSSTHCSAGRGVHRPLGPTWPHPGARAVGRVSEMKQVGAFGVVELQCASQCVEH
jgi:hypothetical protein